MCMHVCNTVNVLMCVLCVVCACTAGVPKKFPRSIHNTGAHLKKTCGERGMNGNGTGDERSTILYVRIPFHFNFPFPVFPCYPRKRAYTHTILYICTIRLHTWQNNYMPLLLLCSNLRLSLVVKTLPLPVY